MCVGHHVSYDQCDVQHIAHCECAVLVLLYHHNYPCHASGARCWFFVRAITVALAIISLSIVRIEMGTQNGACTDAVLTMMGSRAASLADVNDLACSQDDNHMRSRRDGASSLCCV